MKLFLQLKKGATAHLGKQPQHRNRGYIGSGSSKTLGVGSWRNAFAKKSSNVPSESLRRLRRGKMRPVAVHSKLKNDVDRCFSSSAKWTLH